MNATMELAAKTSAADPAITVAILTALFASLGYVIKLGVDSLRAYRDRRDARYAKLVELDGLLHASHAVFKNQNELAIRLDTLIQSTQPTLEIPEPAGYENTFAAAYPKMDPGQQKTLGVIRSMTEHAMKPLNDKMLEWLLQDTYWKAQRRGDVRGDLAGSLSKLEAHLYLWRAKYAYWMTDPMHSLVYLADEELHGIEFPRDIDELVKATLGRKTAE